MKKHQHNNNFPSMKFTTGKYFFPAIVCIGSFLVFSLLVLYEFIQGYSHTKSDRYIYASHLAQILRESVNCELRKNKGDFKSLRPLLTQYVKSGTLKHIRIEVNGKTLIGINKKKDYLVDFGSDDFYNIHNILFFRTHIFIGEEKDKKAILIFAFNSKTYSDSTDFSTDLLVMFFFSGCISIAFLFLSWSYVIRNKELFNRLISERNKSEHVDELGLAAAGLAHETKNPLGVIRGLAQNIANNSENPKKTRSMARDIMEETDVTTTRLGDFLSYAKIRQPSLVSIKTHEYIERLVGLVKDEFTNAGVKLDVNIEVPHIDADQDMLSQIIMNLLTNSLRFTEKGGKVTLSLCKKHNKTVELRVEDNGTGIAENILPNILKPYVTSSSKGYGIGLAIVKRIADQSGWHIKVNSILEKGTSVIISNITMNSSQENTIE